MREQNSPGILVLICSMFKKVISKRISKEKFLTAYHKFWKNIHGSEQMYLMVDLQTYSPTKAKQTGCVDMGAQFYPGLFTAKALSYFHYQCSGGEIKNKLKTTEDCI